MVVSSESFSRSSGSTAWVRGISRTGDVLMSTSIVSREPERIEEVFRDEESLFVRDVVEGQLVRFEKAVTSDFQTDVPLTIDGLSVTVKAAVPATDAQGNILNDAEGMPIPRRTTIYDATRQLCSQQNRENPIPILCHQDHLNPVGVCRVCMVEIQQERRGRKMVQMVPACTRRVEPGMLVHTVASPDENVADRLKASVRVITELLASDHLQTRHRSADSPTPLENLVDRFLGESPSRFVPNDKPRPKDESSFVIAVDHSACILCDRCVRACTQVKQNNVIGRTGKGYTAKIGFDLDLPMGESSCVSCGE
ncbi:MAG: 2Fe-2S iron-sulfur cluster binding domain-containing protein, partial [Planctomycetes bacterium]|nr:2Fe-2S iron-sulfur cluster binding domain-containing protein [Planctomycetota bacterium]